MKSAHGFLILVSRAILFGFMLIIATLSSIVADEVRSARPLDLKQVRLLDGPFRQAMLRNQEYLLSMEPDRLLHMFRVTAGLPSSAQPYGGWEAPSIEVRGHSLGHYLTALSLLYAATGEQELKTRVDYIVAELAKCQEALASQQGAQPGYLSAFPESFIDRLESNQRVWAPYYVLHKIMAGLLDAYQHCDNLQALDVVTRQADWVKRRMDRLSLEQQQRVLDFEFGGMNEVLANLYEVTNRNADLNVARMFDHHAVFDPLAQGEDRLDGLHANTQIPKFIGAARFYELSGEPRYHDVAKFAWERVALHRSYVIGGHSDREHFFPPEQFSQHVTAETCETCNTYNMLKLTRHLFGWQPSAQVMDFYERGLYNHILASQDPEEGMLVYLMSLKPGHFKTYSLPYDSFWCCVGTGMENHCKYGDTIYYQDDDSLYVNLFIASELTWDERNLKVRMETKLPEEDRVRLKLTCDEPVDIALKIRWPSWAKSGFAVAINGQMQELAGQPGCYVAFRRQWRDGDQLEICVPMRLRSESLPGTSDVVALLYGPLVLAGELGRDGLDSVSPYVSQQVEHLSVPTPDVPVLVVEPQELLSHVKTVPERPLAFRTQDIGRPSDVTLIPFYQIHHQRYSVYWDLFTPGGWDSYRVELAAAKRRARKHARQVLDFVIIGDAKSEKRHNLQGQQTQAGTYVDRGWRHAVDGGWFSYDVGVTPNDDTVLQVTFWGEDVGARVFDILVDGTKISTQTLNRNEPGEFFHVRLPLTSSVTGSKKTVTVRFQAHPGNFAGGLFGLETLKQEK